MKKALHPKSRKAGQVRKRLHHDIRVKKKHKQRLNKTKLLEFKLQWFRDNYPRDKTHLTHQDQLQLIERYLERLRGYMADPDEPVSVSTDVFNAYLRQEREEFSSCGLMVPDLTSKKNVTRLLEWNNERSVIPAIVMNTIRKPQK